MLSNPTLADRSALAYAPGVLRLLAIVAVVVPLAAVATMGRSSRITVGCAAGWRASAEPILDDRGTAGDGHDFAVSYGGSGQLAAQAQLGQRFDLLLMADASYLDRLEADGRRWDRIPIATQRAGLLLAPDTPQPTWEDVASGRVRLSLASPKTAAVSRVVERTVGPRTFDAIRRQARVERTNVVEAANDAARLDVAAAALVWDTTAANYPDRRFIPLSALNPAIDPVGEVQLGVRPGDAQLRELAETIAAALRMRDEGKP